MRSSFSLHMTLTDCGPIVTSNDEAHADQKLCISETEFVNMDPSELAVDMSSIPDHHRGSGGARNGLFVYSDNVNMIINMNNAQTVINLMRKVKQKERLWDVLEGHRVDGHGRRLD